MTTSAGTRRGGAADPLHGYGDKGVPQAFDKFVMVGKCASTGKEIKLCYNTFGNPLDPCLLLVMGLGGTLVLWRESFVQKLVGAGFYVIRFDNRDVGLSTHLDEFSPPNIVRMILPSWASIGEGRPPYTLDDMANDAWGLLTALKITRAHLLGTSMGGMIAQCMALRHPERVKSLTIVFSHSSGPRVKPQTWGMSFAMLKRPASQSIEEYVSFKVKMSAFFAGDYQVDEPEVRAVTLASFSRAVENKAGFWRQVWAIQRAESRDAGLRRLRGIPTLIVHGMMDTMIPFENGLQLAHLIYGSKLVAFPRMGHSLPKELLDEIVAEMALLKVRGERASGEGEEHTSAAAETDTATQTPCDSIGK